MIDQKDSETQSDLWKELEKACYEYDFKKRKFCTAVIDVCEDSSMNKVCRIQHVFETKFDAVLVNRKQKHFNIGV